MLLEFAPKALKQLKKLDIPTKHRIEIFIQELPNNYHKLVPLSGSLSGFLKYRVGDYRIIIEKSYDKFTIHLVDHRRDVYKLHDEDIED